jgi:cold shock CspA family protein
MPLDFGEIKEYNSTRGFGFVSSIVRTCGRSREKIFFHITKIKCKCLDLAGKLDRGHFLNVCFWYNTEKTSKGEQVTEIWLTAEDIPSSQRNKLIPRIEELWHNIQDTPSWLDELTLELFGEEHRNQLQHIPGL